MPRRKTVSQKEQRRAKQRQTSRPGTARALNTLPAARPPPMPELPPLLHTRQQAARLLSCSTATLIRLERAGALRPIKLNKETKVAQTYYAHSDLLVLASGR
jgi:hypothetical protein